MYYLYNKLLKIKEAPEEYIDRKSIILLNHYINGYIFLNIENYHFPECYRELMDEFGIDSELLHWSKFANTIAFSDECAFNAFYIDLLRDFSEETQIFSDHIDLCKVNEEEHISLDEILQRIKDNPESYIEQKSLMNLNAFVKGYIDCHNDFYSEKIYFYPKFQDFIQNKFDIKFQRNWASIITFYYNDNEKAFEMFFVLLEEFKKRTNNELSGG